jgi:methylated-DNA-[protein]-cysteine S-methyltransferase
MKWLVFDTSWGWAAVLSDNRLIKQTILPSAVGLNEFKAINNRNGGSPVALP